MKLEDTEINSWLVSHSKWQREGDLIHREVTLSSFPAAIAYVVQAGFLAEAADHHPDLDIRWCTVRIGLTTHDAGGITRKDLALAEALSALAELEEIVEDGEADAALKRRRNRLLARRAQ